jgi:hypothetical protein
VTEEKASDRFGRMTLRHMAIDRGRMSLMAARRGTKNPNRGREMVYRVSQVMKKWKQAKVAWASLREGSEKIALLVKT